jgi:hypothetical protein
MRFKISTALTLTHGMCTLVEFGPDCRLHLCQRARRHRVLERPQLQPHQALSQLPDPPPSPPFAAQGARVRTFSSQILGAMSARELMYWPTLTQKPLSSARAHQTCCYASSSPWGRITRASHHAPMAKSRVMVA